MNERLQYVETFDVDKAGRDRKAIFNAFVTCLTPEEACQALDTYFEQPSLKRHALVRHIQHHMKRKLLPCHTELMDVLEQRIIDLPGAKRKSAASVLLRLAEALNAEDEQDILKRLSRSLNATVRRQVYRRVKELTELPCPDYIVSALELFGDFEAARIIVTRGSTAILVSNFAQLENALASTGILLSRLYLRLLGQPPADLICLKEIDPISYVYVCAKLGLTIPPGELISTYRANMFTDRSGLIAWCCGQMGHWEALMEILHLDEDPPKDVLEAAYPWCLSLSAVLRAQET